ncbi:glycosyltransferase family 2 protein [Aestuariivirga sp.]|uniref:glycosyltransferase family 2 protein n=1 Tax=Aestuariivirga sp. TaxID=2650926 RepID=UPI00391A380B
MSFSIRKLDNRPVQLGPHEIVAFACVRNEVLRLPFLLEHHRSIGVNRFFFIDNLSTDGTVDLLLREPDCHLFTCDGKFFAENVEPPRWSNALRRTFCEGHWCLSLDADEMFVYPHCESRTLHDLCAYMDSTGATALEALVIDCYGDSAVLETDYRSGQSFIQACPYFDPELGYEVDNNGACPPRLMFSRFRERAFWQPEHKRQRPPCITQVPLVRWTKGTGYLVAQHALNAAKLSELRAAVLHFKFLPGFFNAVSASLEENAGVQEKGLKERVTYIDTLKRNPNLNLRHPGSVRYEGSRQLIELGWMRTSRNYEEFQDGGNVPNAMPKPRSKPAA